MIEPLIKAQPNDTTAEYAVLGCMALRSSAIDRAGELLEADDFYLEGHGVLFDMMTTLHSSGRAIDVVTMRSEADRRGILELVGGKDYFVNLISSQFTTAHLDHYAKIVSDKSVYRKMIAEGYGIAEEAWTEAQTADALIEDAERRFLAIRPNRGNDDSAMTFKDIATAEIAAVHEAIANPSGHRSFTGLSTGFDRLDWYLSGLNPGTLTLLAARPSVGKTALSVCITANVAKAGHTVAVFTLEMSKQKVTQRILGAEFRIDTHDLGNHGIDIFQLRKIEEGIGRLWKGHIVIDDNSNLTASYLRGKLRRIKAKYGLGLVVIDHIGLMGNATFPVPRGQTRNDAVSEISRALKIMSHEFGVPILALSQLSRDGEKAGRVPILSDLRDSGSLEQDADAVLFLHRQSYQDGSVIDKLSMDPTSLIVGKQRNGPTGVVNMGFTPAFARFDEMETKYGDPGYGPTPGSGW